jgi:hypothetical protein
VLISKSKSCAKANSTAILNEHSMHFFIAYLQ